MPSNTDDDYSPTNSNRQENRSNEAKRHRSGGDQQARAKHEASRILEDVTGSPTEYVLPKSGWAANRRIPYLYYINDNKTILIILQGDITRTKVDAIVNAANEHMTGGGGVDGIIHDAAGDQLYEACKAHKEIYRGVRLPTGHSRILLSYDMSRTTYYIINTAGPRYSRYNAGQCAEELTSCYQTSLALAGLYDLESVGFTAISCGIFGYPVDEGAQVALETVDKEAGSVPVVVFVLWDDHIYDAWKKTAARLKFTPIDPKDLLAEESPSSTTATATTSTPDAELLNRLPSVPKDEPDTQNIDSQDVEENNGDDSAKPLLTTQHTAEMNEDDGEKENLTEKTDNPSNKPEEQIVETDTTNNLDSTK